MDHWLLVFTFMSALSTLSCSQRIKFDEKFNNEWSVVSGRMHQPQCIDIPQNLSLCNNIGYSSMRLPNLLEHDNLNDLTEQADNWVPLIGVRCSDYTRIFLCSLFTPVCLERVVYPCRSLCESVRNGCEIKMKQYGFPWPDMLRCDKFPTDDELCIPAPSNDEGPTSDDRLCEPCKQPDTMEGILDSYCSSNFVIRAKVKGFMSELELGDVQLNMGSGKKKFYKRDRSFPKKVAKDLASPDVKIYIKQGLECHCDNRIQPKQNHLLAIKVEERYNRLGEKETRYYAEMITPWADEDGEGTRRSVKKAIRAINKSEDDKICEGGLSTLNIHKDSEKNARRKHRRNRQ